MTIEGPLPEYTKALTDGPCPPTGRAPVPGIRFIHRTVNLPEFEDDLHAATVARHAVMGILRKQADACERQAEPWELTTLASARPDDFARELVGFLTVAWTDFEYRHALKPMHPRNALCGALAVPWWAAGHPLVLASAVQRGIPIIPIGWEGPADIAEPTSLPTGRVLVLASRGNMPPSLLEQNYDVTAVYPFTIRKPGA